MPTKAGELDLVLTLPSHGWFTRVVEHGVEGMNLVVTVSHGKNGLLVVIMGESGAYSRNFSSSGLRTNPRASDGYKLCPNSLHNPQVEEV